MQKQRSVLALIFVLIVAAITVIVTIPTRLGLDLQGGSQLTIQVKTTPTIPKIEPGMLEAVRRIVENRVNGLGVSESVVQTVGENQILVQLPGVNDPQQAERVLGGTAKLDFREQLPGTETQLGIERQLQQELLAKQTELRTSKNDEAAIKENQAALKRSNEAIAKLYKSSGLGGENLKDAQAQPTGGNDWNVALRFDTKGGELFAELTKNLAGTGRTLGIFLDERMISSPVVGVEFAQTGITGGNAVIQGRFTAQEANDLGVQLRGGALPVPVEIIENRTVGASLGRDSIQSSINAGLGGLILVLIFMVGYYRLPGVIANIALLIYALLTWAAFVLLGVTLTLPGIAGFVLSIGMAVDANVLIFERTREELRAGKTLYRSVESGFYRAFSSILDGNVTTLIACAALFWLGAGLVKGFAVTLALGVVVSMFTALTCSRTLLFVVLSFPGFRKPQWFCPDLSKTVNS
ncbi:protein translocase subunit SecD [Microcoleus sp. LEGE 07076]|uniref:protein translocase subunit SecD n=1 Tax=Microcoleus sp. LEGE 07076 TaxID=915322 RepID=UPI00188233D0|nr:protein translocase subunit SecD [Microcoleus sp. LEGE 07076]MBE9186260.1 protein translocase subunit SecD [Microcoleus sp. LEGE 07076]